MEQTLIVDKELFLSMLYGGLSHLAKNKDAVNDLNVFPIPDGDTGDNMYMTLASGCHPGLTGESVSQIAEEVAKGMLIGARGNSGVILSQIFAGIADGLSGTATVDVEALNRAMQRGVKFAYSAVDTPVEGTILTVFKDAAARADALLHSPLSVEEYFDEFLAELRRSLSRTPELLPVLKESGVVDSGGAGLLYIMEGMSAALSGDAFEEPAAPVGAKAATLDFSLFDRDTPLLYGYCTEMLLRLQDAKCDVDAFAVEDFLLPLRKMGDSIACFQTGTIVKLHIHTKSPGEVLGYAQGFGEFLTLKIENMTLQHNETEEKEEAPLLLSTKPHKKYAAVAVAAGEGVKQCFLELGADAVVSGGQSMNPSADDFLHAFAEIDADHIFVFPNNGNIVLAARQAAGLYTKSDVRVIESHTVGEGYAALSMFDTTLSSADEVEEELSFAMEGVVTGTVAKASKDAHFDGMDVKSGHYIGFVGKHIHAEEEKAEDAVRVLCRAENAARRDVLILIGGENADKEKAETLLAELKKEFPKTEVFYIDGGQPIYDYMVVLE
ncbi:MAG: DAK2 domain-containing protein [Clostridia bacterium]|nr:DAK2 domain-containing protein [Clostridia bacterium]